MSSAFHSNLSKKPYKGTRDFFPAQKRQQDYLFQQMQKSAELFGYEPYNGPLLEEVELYKAKSGEELINEQIYSFTDRGQRLVAIRPEMTPTLARMIAQIHREVPKPIRFYSIPNLMRYENPQKGRLREHWQLNCDIFGAPASEGEIEILQVVIHLLESFGANSHHFEILVNDRRVVDAVFNDLLQLNQAQTYQLYKIVDKSKKVTIEALKEMVKAVGLTSQQENIFFGYTQLKTFDQLFTFLTEYKIHPDKIIPLRSVIETFRALSLDHYFLYDPTIVRGLDYYTGIVFEVFDKNPANRRALCGGGAYANLLEIFNEPSLPGVGFGFGDVTLKDFLEVHQLMPDCSHSDVHVYLSFLQCESKEANYQLQKVAHLLRKDHLKTMVHLEPIKLQKLFPLAEKRGAKWVGMMGEDELKEGVIIFKELHSKHQEKILVADLLAGKESELLKQLKK